VSELATRLRHRLRRAGNETVAPRIEHGGLSMNLETYQASISGRVMDLTYMEYELLRFLATNPNRVFTARRCSVGYGATSTTAARARWTCTCADYGRNWVKKTRT